MTHASEPAWPVIKTEPSVVGEGGDYTVIADTYSHGGLTKREALKVIQDGRFLDFQ